jgi:hypothetical protein
MAVGSRSVSSTFEENPVDIARLQRKSAEQWWIQPYGKMRVPAVIFATEALIRDMDEKVYEQVTNVATLPGIVKASYAMPDAHWGYGFPIGGVAAFDADKGGVISAGGVGFDISCGVRTLLTGLTVDQIQTVKDRLADALFRKIPAGVGSRGKLSLNEKEMNSMLAGGAQWAVKQGYGTAEDLQRVEEGGCIQGAHPHEVSDRAKKRQREEMGTLGSGNHYLEVQHVAKIVDRDIAEAFGISQGNIVLSIHWARAVSAIRLGLNFSPAWPPLPRNTVSISPTASWLARRSTRPWGMPIWAPCGRRSIARWRIARSSHIWCGKRSKRYFPKPSCRSFTTYRTTPAKLKSMPWTGKRCGSSSTARAPRAPLGRARNRTRPLREVGQSAFDRRHDGHRFLYSSRHEPRHGSRIRLRLSWRGAQHEPAPGLKTVAWIGSSAESPAVGF